MLMTFLRRFSMQFRAKFFFFFLPDYFPWSFHFAMLPTIMHFQGAGLTTTGDSARVGKEIGMPLSLAPCIRPHMLILVNVNRFPQTLLV